MILTIENDSEVLAQTLFSELTPESAHIAIVDGVMHRKKLLYMTRELCLKRKGIKCVTSGDVLRVKEDKVCLGIIIFSDLKGQIGHSRFNGLNIKSLTDCSSNFDLNKSRNIQRILDKMRLTV
jgi:hypothetical protein